MGLLFWNFGGVKLHDHDPLLWFCIMQVEFGKEEDSYCKRKCRSWGIQRVEEEIGLCGGFRLMGGEEEEEEENKTLELFPLHPEGR